MLHKKIGITEGQVEIIRQSKLFQNVPDATLAHILKRSVILNYTDGHNIISEGDKSQAFFVILDGEVGVYKKEPDTGEDYLFTTLETGDEFGELSLIIEQERSASVRAIGDVMVVGLSIDVFKSEQPVQFSASYSTIWKNLARQLGKRLINTDDLALQHLQSQLALAKTQNAMAEFIVIITVIMTIFSFVTALLGSSSNVAAVDAFSNIASGIAVIAFLVLIYRSPYSFKTFGFNIPENLWRHIGMAFVWSAGLIVLAIIAKVIAIQTIPALEGFPLFFIPGQEYEGLEYAAAKLTIGLTLGYVALALVQEIMTRGVIQGVLTEFFHQWSYKHAIAILLSNGLFAAGHLHISPTFAIITFFAGCMWGIQYVFKPSIIGVWISHTLVGLFALRILGLVAMIRIIEM